MRREAPSAASAVAQTPAKPIISAYHDINKRRRNERVIALMEAAQLRVG